MVNSATIVNEMAIKMKNETEDNDALLLDLYDNIPENDLENLEPKSKPVKSEQSRSPSILSDSKTDGSFNHRRHSHSPSMSRERRPSKSMAQSTRPQLIWNLPNAQAQAMDEFKEIPSNLYQNKGLGLASYLDESMLCDCTFNPNKDTEEKACGESCINRQMMVECLEDDCRCGQYCQNQRLQQKLYADIDIVETEKKGYGVRALSDMSADTFIYEYVGEVIGQSHFVKRMKEYFEERIKHFYFMALSKDEFIDATKKGGLGRFLNHSCRPNCKVEKWLVGKHMRMGIFAKRAILAGEELTFNYNVDRYGHDAQECFCAESNCVGFIGGKQQTDIAAMDELYLDALGITDEVESLNLKGSKKRKSHKMDIDYIPIMKPIAVMEVVKVASAIRQAITNRRILTKLLSRVLLTDDKNIQGHLMTLHGFSSMAHIITEYKVDFEVLESALRILSNWPLITRNKLQSTNIEPLVLDLATAANDIVRDLAESLIKSWVDLQVAYRIPKSMRDASSEGDEDTELFAKRPRTGDTEDEVRQVLRQAAATRHVKERPLPPGWKPAFKADGQQYWYHIDTRQTIERPPTYEDASRLASEWQASQAAVNDVASIISRVKAEAEAREAAEAAQAELNRQLEANKPPSSRKTKSSKHSKSKSASRDKSKSTSKDKFSPAAKEKNVTRLFSTVVVHTMSRYKHHFEPDQFKRRAKEITEVLCTKEKKSSHYATDSYTSLSAKKESGIKDFVKTYITKLLQRKGITPTPKSSHSKAAHDSAKVEIPSTSMATTSSEVTAINGIALDSEGVTEDPDEAAMIAELNPEDDSSDEEEDTKQSTGHTSPPSPIPPTETKHSNGHLPPTSSPLFNGTLPLTSSPV